MVGGRFESLVVLIGVSNVVKRHHDQDNFYKEKYLTGWLIIQRLIHYCYGGTWCRQTWCWRGNCILHRQQEMISLFEHSMSICQTPKPASTMTHFLQQDHIYFKKATFPNSASPFGGHFLSNYHTSLRILLAFPAFLSSVLN